MKEQLGTIIEKIAAIADSDGEIKEKAVGLIMDTGMELFTGLIELAIPDKEAPSNKKAWADSTSPEVRDTIACNALVRAYVDTSKVVYSPDRQFEASRILDQRLSLEISPSEWVAAVRAVHGDTFELVVNLAAKYESANGENKEILTAWDNYLTQLPSLFDHRLIAELDSAGFYDYLDSLGLLYERDVQLLPTDFYKVQATVLGEIEGTLFLEKMGIAYGDGEFNKCNAQRDYTKYFKSLLSQVKPDEAQWNIDSTYIATYTKLLGGKLRTADISAIAVMDITNHAMVRGRSGIPEWLAMDVISKVKDLTLVEFTRILAYYERSSTESANVLALFLGKKGVKQLRAELEAQYKGQSGAVTCVVSFNVNLDTGVFIFHKDADKESIEVPFGLSGRTLHVSVPQIAQTRIDTTMLSDYIRKWADRCNYGAVIHWVA